MNDPSGTMKLECGASLAEAEHHHHDHVGPIEGSPAWTAHLACDLEPSLTSRAQDGTPSPSLLQTNLSLSCVHSVDALRSLISRDVVQDINSDDARHGPVTMFASPFELPVPLSSTATNNNCSHNTKLSLSSHIRRPLHVPLIYCDQTASNRPLRSLEQYMQQQVCPFYGNTHTNTSVTGSQSTAFVAEARQIVAEAANAKITGKAAVDVVLFAGNGATSAVELLIDCLGLHQHHPHSGDQQQQQQQQQQQRPVVFVGPYEHHSNLIPWRESGCEIVMIPENAKTGDVDLQVLARAMQHPACHGRLKIGTFSAASNVTGKLSDTNAIATLLHRYGALAFFDYATAAPYVRMDMNPTLSTGAALDSDDDDDPSIMAKDAMFLSSHKMLGGPGAPGILIVKKALVSQTNAPRRSGGGTVFYVTHDHHRFLSNRVERYEGGTPNGLGIARAGLAFLLKRQLEQQYDYLAATNCQDKKKDENVVAITSNKNDRMNIPSMPVSILDHDCQTYHRVARYWQDHAPRLVLLGYSPTLSNMFPKNDHLPIFSFLIRFGNRFLHYNYVCALLNDLFGIQTRGGCQCAGPYSQLLLGLTERYTMTSNDDMDSSEHEPIGCCYDRPNAQNHSMEHALLHYKERAELLRPGYTRLSLPFKGLTDVEIDYVLRAVTWVSHHGWALMCQYRCNHRTGEWRHASRQGKPLGKEGRRWLSHFDFTCQANSDKQAQTTSHSQPTLAQILEETLKNADAILEAAKHDNRSIVQALKMVDADHVLGTDDDAKLGELRWYVYPKECAMLLTSGKEAPADLEPLMGAIAPRTEMVSTSNKPSVGNAIGDFLVPAAAIIPTPSESKNAEMDAEASNLEERKRKPTINETTSAALLSEPPSNGALLCFRDGDHTGEAPLQDIAAGCDKGELSEHCHVFDPERKQWVRFSFYASGNNKKMKLGNTTREGDSSKKKHLNDNLARKKAPRDSSAWGKGVVVDPLSSVPDHARQVRDATSDKAASVTSKKLRHKHVKPPPKLMRLITKAVIEWDMIHEGDRLLLGLSGGKDSLSLLHCLLELKRKLPIKFDIEVCTIDPMTPSFDPSPLIPYVESIGLRYHFVRDQIVSRASNSGKEGAIVTSLCAYCARMKRGNLYACARTNKCNKLVLAQHLDDCAESFFMSVMHNGFLRTMKANYEINAGDLSVIRPMVYCRESLMTAFAKSANLPIINENCPACFEEPKERARVKKLLSREETLYPNFYDSIRRSLVPLMHDESTAILRCYLEETIARSKIKFEPRCKAGKADSRTTENGCATFKDVPRNVSDVLRDVSDDDLLRELARRKAEKFRLAGAMKRIEGDDDDEGPTDPTGQVCTLDGRNGTVPCRELME